VYLRGARDGAWAPPDGGELRLWPRGGGDRTVAASVGAAWEGRATQGQLDDAVLGWWRNASQALDVEPAAGRLVLFDSRLVHEVRPHNGSTPRCALTLWVHRPPRTAGPPRRPDDAPPFASPTANRRKK
jgi:hypothetical protein